MSRPMFILFLSLVPSIFCGISPSIIEQDADEISKLHAKFLQISPSIPVREAYDLRCQAVLQCCPKERENIYAMFTDGHFNDKCLGNGTKVAVGLRPEACLSTLRRLIQLTKSEVSQKYFEVLGNHKNRINRIRLWKQQMRVACTNDELHAFYCQRDNMKKFKSCQKKVLEMFAKEHEDEDDIIYKTYVSQWKEEYLVDNQRIARVFSKPKQ